MVFHAGPGVESWWPALAASLCSGTWPTASDAAFADEWRDFLFFESLASAGAIANATMTKALTKAGGVRFFTFCMMNLLEE